MKKESYTTLLIKHWKTSSIVLLLLFLLLPLKMGFNSIPSLDYYLKILLIEFKSFSIGFIMISFIWIFSFIMPYVKKGFIHLNALILGSASLIIILTGLSTPYDPLVGIRFNFDFTFYGIGALASIVIWIPMRLRKLQSADKKVPIEYEKKKISWYIHLMFISLIIICSTTVFFKAYNYFNLNTVAETKLSIGNNTYLNDVKINNLKQSKVGIRYRVRIEKEKFPDKEFDAATIPIPIPFNCQILSSNNDTIYFINTHLSNNRFVRMFINTNETNKYYIKTETVLTEPFTSKFQILSILANIQNPIEDGFNIESADLYLIGNITPINTMFLTLSSITLLISVGFYVTVLFSRRKITRKSK